MDEKATGDELRDREAKDSSTRSEGGSPGAYGPETHGG